MLRRFSLAPMSLKPCSRVALKLPSEPVRIQVFDLATPETLARLEGGVLLVLLEVLHQRADVLLEARDAHSLRLEQLTRGAGVEVHRVVQVADPLRRRPREQLPDRR